MPRRKLSGVGEPRLYLLLCLIGAVVMYCLNLARGDDEGQYVCCAAVLGAILIFTFVTDPGHTPLAKLDEDARVSLWMLLCITGCGAGYLFMEQYKDGFGAIGLLLVASLVFKVISNKVS